MFPRWAVIVERRITPSTHARIALTRGTISYGNRPDAPFVKHLFDMAELPKLYTPREAAHMLGIGYPTLKTWIYEKKIRTIQTAGGHHRIPENEIDKYLYRTTEKQEVFERRSGFRQISGRNQLAGRVTSIQIDGLIAQVTLSIGEQKITSIITADAVREMHLKKGDKAAALIKSTKVMILRP